jgi:hypothetical protein
MLSDQQVKSSIECYNPVITQSSVFQAVRKAVYWQKRRSDRAIEARDYGVRRGKRYGKGDRSR